MRIKTENKGKKRSNDLTIVKNLKQLLKFAVQMTEVL